MTLFKVKVSQSEAAAASDEEGDLSSWKRSADGAYSDSSPRTNCHIDGTAIFIIYYYVIPILV